MVSGAGHEINNPLSAIMLSVAASQRYLQPLIDASRAVSIAAESGFGLPSDEVARLSMSVTPILAREGGPAITRVLGARMGAAGLGHGDAVGNDYEARQRPSSQLRDKRIADRTRPTWL